MIAINYLKSDVTALLPCAVKIPMEAKVAGFIKENIPSVKYEILSNAVVQEDIFDSLRAIGGIEDLPEVLIAPGFGNLFYPYFVEKYVRKGFFESVLDFEVSDAYQESGVVDPKNFYDIIAVNPLVFMTDSTNYPGMKPPEKWEDILSPMYENKIAFRGHTEDTICEGVLFETYSSHGTEGVKRLAPNIKCRLHPAQMVSLAGTKESPYISVLPLSFANLVKETDRVKIIWPQDGAVMNPVVMLTKKDCRDDVKQAAKYFLSREIGDLFLETGFCSLRPEIEKKMPRTGKYKWVGWDFLRSNNIEALHIELNRLVHLLETGR